MPVDDAAHSQLKSIHDELFQEVAQLHYKWQQ